MIAASHQPNLSTLCLASLLGLLLLPLVPAKAQLFEEARYGGDFLSVGGGARPLGMGSAFVATTNDVLSGYWNAAGLTDIDRFELAYMHSERFGGLVAFDYGAVALPIQGSAGVLGISFFRQGIDGIKNTLHAWDPEQNRPRPDPTRYMKEFNASDMAFLLSYAHPLTGQWNWGVTAKVLHSRLGPFANAWGYSFDAGLQRRGERLQFGVNLQNLPALMKFWTVNESQLEGLTEFIHPETGKPETLPEGANEYVKPSIKIGLSTLIHIGDFSVLTALDSDIYFEGRQAYYLHMGHASFEPHLGLEFGYRDLLFLRTGLTDLHRDDRGTYFVSPTLGTGLRLGMVTVDYGFAGFAGLISDLGFTHRISLQLGLPAPGSNSR